MIYKHWAILKALVGTINHNQGSKAMLACLKKTSMLFVATSGGKCLNSYPNSSDGVEFDTLLKA